ncbi:histidinol-phosphate transaminase [Salirhabdus salicampi]|uniref:histidinol-phosphate transaminase n=1 Tax=Salirhabdus salicampi TaxID=476102 RepID=UPI0020C44F38|nr:histidinol-phosphate transaminase [Salirhabdus salicampi]MCP8616696.1 histidinol-phosphate transaminase [Salirhabdus salicampi]
MEPKRIIKTLTPYQPGKSIEEVKKEYGLTEIVKLASNENPYGFSTLVEETLRKDFLSVHQYPDGYARQLRERLASHLQVAEHQLIFGSGSDEIVQMICRTFLTRHDNTVMATPTFPQYRHHANIEGAEIREVPLLEGSHNLEEMLAAIDKQTKVVWLCTPNNPTGGYIQQEDLFAFIERCPSHVLIVIDEAYFEYVTAEDYPNTIPLLQNYQNIIILRTFSKAYGLAGLRVGYGIGNEQIISYLNTVRGPFNTTTVGQLAATVALKDQMFIRDTCEKNEQNRRRLEAFCVQKGLSYFPSETNFLLIHLPNSGLEVAEQLLQNGFIVRAGELLGIDKSIRVTVPKDRDVDPFLEALSKIL